MILPINHIANWRYISQHKQSQIEKGLICENSTRIDCDYNIRDKFMVRSNQDYKHETKFQGPYEIIQTCTNLTVTIQICVVIARLNICRLKPNINGEVE